jgi:TrmH family RNA methyltransferase
MPSGTEQKLIRKLNQRKYRWQEKLFIAEGPKVIADLVSEGLEPVKAWSTELNSPYQPISEKDLKAISGFSTANESLAIFPFPMHSFNNANRILILDGINDPGNLGTLIRTADWFGFSEIYCITGTADVYNPKTVQSTMGSIARVNIAYADAQEIYETIKDSHRLLSADMQGQSLGELKQTADDNIALVMGSESHGPSDFWKAKTEAITIEKRNTQSGIDSLNVAVAGAILMERLS